MREGRFNGSLYMSRCNGSLRKGKYNDSFKNYKQETTNKELQTGNHK